MSAITTHPTCKVSLADIQAMQQNERGLKPMPLDADLLIKRIEQGGHSGQFLANAFKSAYRMIPFNRSLGDLVKLDAEAFRLFHQVLHMRHINGWSDDVLYSIERRIINVMEGAK